jgi:hypothetical protein
VGLQVTAAVTARLLFNARLTVAQFYTLAHPDYSKVISNGFSAMHTWQLLPRQRVYVSRSLAQKASSDVIASIRLVACSKVVECIRDKVDSLELPSQLLQQWGHCSSLKGQGSSRVITVLSCGSPECPDCRSGYSSPHVQVRAQL